MEILIVIEIQPFDYSKNNYTTPKGSIIAKPNEWSDYWFKSVSDSKLNIKPIELGSWLVDIQSLNINNLKIIIEKHFEEIDLVNFEDELLAFSGGIVIRENNKILIEPQCCADLSDIYKWKNLKDNNIYNQLWIGHPYIYYKIKNDTILFSEYTEQDDIDIENIVEKFKINKQEFLSETPKIEIIINEFKKKILQILNEMKMSNAEKISEILIGK